MKYLIIYAHLKFAVYGRKHTRNFRQCSHASMGLAQARPNKTSASSTVVFVVENKWQSL